MKKFRVYNIAALFFLLCLIAISPINSKEKKMTMKVTSSAFENGEFIPPLYTCNGKNISPDLKWSGFPKGTKSFAVIADDPDAPMGEWVHWIVYDIPANVTELEKNFPKDRELPNGVKQGVTDFGKPGYGGPCPPSGTHRYFFKVYALDEYLNLPAGLTKAQLLKSMEGHILAKGELMGKYKRK